jgi:diguanylate cyclase (GGDEF) domain
MGTLKNIYNEQKDLKDKMFFLSITTCIFMVITCALLMVLEGNSLWTVIVNIGAALLMLMLFRLAFKKDMKSLARGVFVYFMNIVVLTYLFFVNGGINSGMPIYLVAGLIVIILSEYGIRRYIALGVCTVFHIISIFISYMFMTGQAEKRGLPVLVTYLDESEEVYDTAISLVIVGLWIGITLILVFNAYEKEKHYNDDLMNKLADMAVTDELTGINNRRYMFNYLETHEDLFGSDTRYLAMFDLDFFKTINDTYGHLLGDDVLSRFGDVLLNQAGDPEVELAARYGGEEFVLLFNADSKKDALDRIDGIRQEMRQIKIEKYPDLNLTVSAGLVLCRKYNSVITLLKDADDCLYEAKSEGRDRVISSI